MTPKKDEAKTMTFRYSLWCRATGEIKRGHRSVSFHNRADAFDKIDKLVKKICKTVNKNAKHPFTVNGFKQTSFETRKRGKAS